MSKTSNFLKSTLVTASLLMAGAAHAGDATSDREESAANARPGAVEHHQSSGSAQPAEAKACHCASAAPISVPVKSLLDDPDFTGYLPG